MQKFSTKEIRHEFEVDGEPYYLPGVSIADFAEAARLASIDDGRKQIEAYDHLLSSKARSDTPTWRLWMSGRRTPRAAVRALNMMQLGDLFVEWSKMGGSPGESSGSRVSTSPTDAN
jgi:hypothetical protein